MPATEGLSRAIDLDLAAYREQHVAGRLALAFAREGVSDAPALALLLTTDGEARGRFRRSVAISYTGVFRDRAQFELLEHELLPALLADKRRLRVWSAGCANGAELYSVALLLERMGALDRSFLLGSDLLEENIAQARQGVYGAEEMPPHLRRQMRWDRRDLIRDAAPSRHWSLVLCRNVAIYLTPTARDRLHRMLADSLAAGGVLLLGRSERIPDPERLGLDRVGPHAYRRRAV